MIFEASNSKKVSFRWIILAGLIASDICAYSAPKIPACEFTQVEIQDVDGARRTIERLRQEGCLEKVRQTEACLARAALLSEDVAGLFRQFRGKGAATMTAVSALAQRRSATLDLDFNLWRNVEAIQDKEWQSFTEISKLIDEYQNPASSSEDIRQEIARLDRGSSAIRDRISALSKEETALLAFISLLQIDLEHAFAKVSSEVQFLTSDTCQYADLKALAMRLATMVQEWSYDVELVREHLLSLRKTRQNVLTYVYVALRANLEESYRKDARDRSMALGDKVDAILRLHRISSQFEAFYVKNQLSKERDMAETVFLEFEKTRLLLVSDLITQQTYEQQLIKASEGYEDLGAPYLERVRTLLSHTRERLKLLEERGFKGHIFLQRTKAQRILKDTTRLSKPCSSQMQNYLQLSQNIENMGAYRAIEKVWVKAIKACLSKEGHAP